jgi:TonB-linked SusC/RagA family outer membrane protein
MRFRLLYKNSPPPKILRGWLLPALLLLSISAGAQTVTLSFKEAPIERVFAEIKKQTNYSFVYTSEEISAARPVTISIKEKPLKQVLEQLFDEQPFYYSIEQNYIIVKQKKAEPKKTDFEIRGRVVDEKGEGIAGASVKVKNSSDGTATDGNGNFSLKSNSDNTTILISSIGFVSKEVAATANQFTSIELTTSVSKLDEQVIIAYGTTTRRLSTGSVSKISSDEISIQPVDNPIAAIQGRAPGVFVTTLNGMPGGNIKVEIRGKGSIAAGTDPLYIIDGVPYNSTPLNQGFVDFIGVNGEVSPLSNINPLDIESIEVLKDADATAIYGSRGANGVVLITTKKGKQGKTRFNFNLSQGFSKIGNLPQFLNLQQYRELRKEGFKNDGIPATPANAPELFLWDSTGEGVDWGKYMWGRTAGRTNIESSISGGTKNTNFLISGHYCDEGTILRGDENYRTGGSHISLSHSSTDNSFNISFSSSYNLDNSNLIIPSTLAVVGLPPNFPLYDNAGNLNWTGTSSNPIAMMGQRSKSRSTSFVTNLTLSYSLARSLTFKTSLGYSTNELNQILTIPRSTISPTSPQNTNSASFGNNQSRTVIVEPQIGYEKNIHRSLLSILLGSSFEKDLKTGSLIRARDFSNESLLESVGAAASFDYNSSIFNEYKYASVFGRINYQLDKKYLLNVTVRRDGSSRFGPGKQFGNFGSLGAGWIFSAEPFVKSRLPFISYGKFRASYGISGNDQIPDYQYLSTYRTGYVYQGVLGLSPSTVANAKYSWEVNHKLEVALDLGLFKDRVLWTVSYYRNRSDNQLVGFPLPYATGFSFVQANLPALIENSGWETDFSAHLVRQKGFSWDFSINLTCPKNKLLAYPELESSAYSTTFVIGEDISVVKGYHYLGVDPATGLGLFEDVNKDGKITRPQDYVVIGKTSPDFFGGIGQKFTLGSFELNLFFQFVKQRSKGAEMFPGHSRNQFTTVLKRWQKPGDVTIIPRASANPGTTGYTGNSRLALSDAFFYDASYMRFKNFSLSYKIPDNSLKWSNVDIIRIYLNAQNLFTMKKKVNLNDPESLQGGIPPLRTVVAGIQLTF